VGNQITSERVPGAPELDMSNGLTAVFLDVLALAGSDLATDEWERAFVYWLVQHDQERTGLGSVGFDVGDMGWTEARFEAQRTFILRVIDGALARTRWDELPFVPGEELVLPALRAFRLLVEQFPATAITTPSSDAWVPGDPPEYGACARHRVFLHETGCIVCNDAPVDAAPEAAPNRSRR
jgi:hypothetical protein